MNTSSNINTNLVKYYKDRAKEYEHIYFKPERQEELSEAYTLLQEIFNNKEVFEVACGTGYWTEKIALTANSVFATDINKEVIEIAGQKHYPKNNVIYKTANLYTYTSDKKYESLFAGFIWSHILKQDLNSFICALQKFVLPKGFLVVMDNNYVEGSSTAISTTDEFGNTFQTRKLADGSTHLVLKNFPSESYLRELLNPYAARIQFTNLKYFWIAVIHLP